MVQYGGWIAICKGRHPTKPLAAIALQAGADVRFRRNSSAAVPTETGSVAAVFSFQIISGCSAEVAVFYAARQACDDRRQYRTTAGNRRQVAVQCQRELNPACREALGDELPPGRAIHEKWKADFVIVERAGSGISLFQNLNRDGRARWLQPKEPSGSKQERASQQTPKFERGEIWVPKEAPWLEAFEGELASFPHGKHDDQVDSVVQFLAAVDTGNWLTFSDLARGR